MNNSKRFLSVPVRTIQDRDKVKQNIRDMVRQSCLRSASFSESLCFFFFLMFFGEIGTVLNLFCSFLGNIEKRKNIKKRKNLSQPLDYYSEGFHICLKKTMEYGENEKGKRCLECGDDITYGRKGRKFCCDRCKNTWHNRKTRGTRLAKARVMTMLNRNYSILNGILEAGETSAGVEQLNRMGFNFGYCTSYHKIRRHDEYVCFDIKFTLIGSEVVSIRKLPLVSLKDIGNTL